MKSLIFHKETNFKLTLTAYSVIDTLLGELKFQPSSYNTHSSRFSFISYLLPWWFWKVSWHQHFTEMIKKLFEEKVSQVATTFEKDIYEQVQENNQLEEIGSQTFWLRWNCFLAMFVTNFKGKHLFSRLKLPLNYLRNSMDKRLCYLLPSLSIFKKCITGTEF